MTVIIKQPYVILRAAIEALDIFTNRDVCPAIVLLTTLSKITNER